MVAKFAKELLSSFKIDVVFIESDYAHFLLFPAVFVNKVAHRIK